MRLLKRHPIDERRLSRLCAADPDLSAIVELHVDLNDFDSISVPSHVLERLAERCRVQADAVLVETPARPDILLTNYVILSLATKFVKCWLGCLSKFWMRFVNMNLMDSATHNKLS